VLGIPPNYREQFPDAIRTLAGTDNGVLIAQQTAANLHVAPGDTVRIERAGMAPVDVVVDGVVELPQADSLFQKVGAPPGTQPVAPPDNVVLLGQTRWHQVFGPLSALRPDLVNLQIHAALDHTLHPAPASAYTQVSAAAHNLEARSAGGALVGDNLAAALDAARGDAAYARVLFLFLGLPAAVLAGLLTATVVTAGADLRRRDQALLRARGATRRQLMWLAAAEATVVGIAGSAAGITAAALVGLAEFGSPSLGADARTAVGWAAASAAVGMGIAAASVLAPAWRDLRDSSIVTARANLSRTRTPRWTRSGIDVAILAVSGMLFWQAGRTGYQIVLAPEGVPTISVSYWAFVAPALLWIGAALLMWRLSDMLLGRGWTVVARALRPVAGKLSRIVAHSLSRQRVAHARAIVLLALAVAFAVSTATFNATYRAQAEVDAQLTNGADITVTEPPGSSVSAGAAAKLAAVPGVRAVEPIQHRFAYVGADLQDLYGVNPSSITNVTALQDNYFQGGTVEELMNTLAAQPDSILVSAETVKDFQLRPGDTVNLRIQDARTHHLVTVGFHYVGIVSEFPTAPKDSFFVANAGYIAQHTGTDAIAAFLVDTGGHDTAAVADRIKGRGRHVGGGHRHHRRPWRRRLQPDCGQPGRAHPNRARLRTDSCRRVRRPGPGPWPRRTATQLRHRRRARGDPPPTAVICAGRGRNPHHVRAGRGGQSSAGRLSRMLVGVLTGVFDPPPTALAVPWAYLAATAVTIIVAIGTVSAATVRLARQSPFTVLGEQ